MILKYLEWLKIREMGVGPYIGNCTDTNDYTVIGACSDQNTDKKNKEIRQGKVDHKKVKKQRDKI